MIPSPDNITSLGPNEVFVYGANERFLHGAGAARFALSLGAVMFLGPRTGMTYGIPTKDHDIETLSLTNINIHVALFLRHAAENPHETFLVTAIGTGLAELDAEDVAPMFFHSTHNVRLPKVFITVLNQLNP